ncbi:hypothetical protein [Streptomyces sp. NPDC056683]|uniref:hypothetical protein n=1 Tax=Streptomyces sp. NPDC056683 TaxID=3345910 RepID=UPI00369371D8
MPRTTEGAETRIPITVETSTGQFGVPGRHLVPVRASCAGALGWSFASSGRLNVTFGGAVVNP